MSPCQMFSKIRNQINSRNTKQARKNLKNSTVLENTRTSAALIVSGLNTLQKKTRTKNEPDAETTNHPDLSISVPKQTRKCLSLPITSVMPISYINEIMAKIK